ncbi:alpha-hydroxy acid oxidase [Nocardiopsis sp. YSL2]|uniref:alpha-hydroxy acid oxidase n=1 Tax=Nocardiopsis sp. YSL2 TaxID=2939492 RepID=UPI0026F42808|nr:alpha-hydroxy acid oxidase [Nocardiopsis sp. YSL2]
MAAEAVDLADLERGAEAALPASVWDFVAGGSTREAVCSNRTGLDAVHVIPRVLTGAAAVSTRAPLPGGWAQAPLAVAPMAYQCLMHPEGEVEAAQAAKEHGIPFSVSTLTSRSLGDIAATDADLWFQLYWVGSDRRVRELVEHAQEVGCRALVITVDVPVMARRPRDIRNGFRLPPSVRAVLLDEAFGEAHRQGSGSAVARHTNGLFHPALTWDHVRKVREWCDMPIVVKGILDPRDAVLAADHGADAVVVSNHGGRQFGAGPPASARIGPIADAVGERCRILFDSGVRSGADILRALALGASGVLIGRPVLWGLAVGGREGVTRVLDLLQTELAEALVLAGCSSPGDAGDLDVEVGS